MNRQGSNLTPPENVDVNALIGNRVNFDRSDYTDVAEYIDVLTDDRREEREAQVRTAVLDKTAVFSRGGCISQEAVFLGTTFCESHDRSGYQAALCELAKLYQLATEYMYSAQINAYTEPTSIESYDTANFSSETINELVDVDLLAPHIDISDEELESFGYLGWLKP